MRRRIHQTIFYISCLLLAFLLPVFPLILWIVILVMTLNWLISGIYLCTLPRFRKEIWRPATFSFALLYLLYLAGMLWTDNFDYGWFDLGVKFSMLLFPLIFSTCDITVFNRRRLRYLCATFLAGLVAGSFVLFGHAWLVHERWGVANSFYYSHLSWYFHPSYLAMYSVFGICMALCYLAEDLPAAPVSKVVMIAILIIYLEAMIFLLSSKAGLMVLMATQGMFILLLISKKAGLARVILFSIVFAILFAGFSRIFPFAFGRIAKADTMISSSKTMKSDPEDGTIARMAVWNISVHLIREHFLIGVGTGDVKDVYLEAYRQYDLGPLLKKKLNAHNQFFQTFVTLGIPGISLLAASLLIPAWFSLRKKKYIYFGFIFIFALNIMVESMLEAQAGVIFYAFFNSLLFASLHGMTKTESIG